MPNTTGRKSIFVSMDFSKDPDTKRFLDALETHMEKEGVDLKRGITVSDKHAGQTLIWDDQVKRGIDDAECIVVLLDRFNANVGWEAGYALATRPEKVVLAKVGSTSATPEVHEYSLRGRPYVDAWNRDDAAVHADLLKEVRKCCLARAAAVKPYKYPQASSAKFRKRLVLLPQHFGGENLASFFPDDSWERVKPNEPWEKLTAFGNKYRPKAPTDAAWVFVTPLGANPDERDGVQNMNCALLAGYLYGQGKLSQNCVYFPYKTERFEGDKPRYLADQPKCRRYIDGADLKYKIDNDTSDDQPAAYVYRGHAIEEWWDGAGELTKKDQHVLFHPFVRCNATGELLRTVLNPWGDYAGTDAELEEYYNPATRGKGKRKHRPIRWDDIDNKTLLDELTATTNPRTRSTSRKAARFIVAADAGVGKTISLRWLWRKLAEQGQSDKLGRVVPLYIQANELIDGAESVKDIAAKVTKALEAGSSKERQLLQGCLDSQSLTHLLIDGLDQVSPAQDESLPAAKGQRLPAQKDKRLKSLKHFLQQNSHLAVVLAGRRYAIRELDDVLGFRTSDWQILRLKEFDDPEITSYLGSESDHLQIYQNLPRAVQRILCVPRLLALFASMQIPEASKVRSASDIFAWATTGLIESDVNGKKLQDIGKHITNDSAKIEFINKLLARLAYLQLSRFRKLTTGGVKALTPNFHQLRIDNHVINDIHRVMRGRSKYTRKEVRADLTRHILSLGWAVEHQRSAGGGVANTLTSIEWSNKSFLEFFGALWLSRYASPEESQEFSHWVFYHGDRRTELFYHVNMFVAEMPATEVYAPEVTLVTTTTYCDPAVWVRTAEQWYAPLSSRPKGGSRLRSCEMLFRTWRRMHAFAQLDYIDWWDKSYQHLYAQKATVIAEFDVAPQIRAKARKILEGYSGELQTILDSNSRDAQVAKKFAGDGWKRVPSGRFEMGYPTRKLGFPPKTDAFWENRLAAVAGMKRDGTRVKKVKNLMALAKSLNKRYWFTGLIGHRDWQGDVDWLYGVFKELRDSCKPSSAEVAISSAKAAIEKRWRRKDELVRKGEKIQKVRRFDMNELSILNSQFALFEPGHDRQVATYIAASRKADQRKAPTAAKIKAAWQPPDHPATYVSWYAAWAFCQWGRWTEMTDKSGKRITHWLRLPHEPEWEFAARHGRPPSAAIAPIGQPYWWGNTAYKSEEKGDAENLSSKFAHATQRGPGSTSNPKQRADGTEVVPNGLGFYDILGNVWEWSANRYNEVLTKSSRQSRYSRHEPTGKHDSFGREIDKDGRMWEGRFRTTRGGIWYFLNLLARLSHRYRAPPNDCDYKSGFRVVREQGSPDDGPSVGR